MKTKRRPVEENFNKGVLFTQTLKLTNTQIYTIHIHTQTHTRIHRKEIFDAVCPSYIKVLPTATNLFVYLHIYKIIAHRKLGKEFARPYSHENNESNNGRDGWYSDILMTGSTLITISCALLSHEIVFRLVYRSAGTFV